MKNTRPRFKVIELDWYCNFQKSISFRLYQDATEQQAYEICKEEYEDENKVRFYDGPFRYIEECEDPGFPPRYNLKYCIRTNKKCISEHYKPYECYCYQVGRWWKYKEHQSLFTEIYVPQMMSHYEYLKIKVPRKFLSADAYNDWVFHNRHQELRAAGRNIQKCMVGFLKHE